jgi:hypothetical protein
MHGRYTQKHGIDLCAYASQFRKTLPLAVLHNESNLKSASFIQALDRKPHMLLGMISPRDDMKTREYETTGMHASKSNEC